MPDHLGRREAFCERREVHDVGEEDRRPRRSGRRSCRSRPSVARRSGAAGRSGGALRTSPARLGGPSSATLRWWANEARSVKATEPVPMTFNASIVLVNQTGRSASREEHLAREAREQEDHDEARRTSGRPAAPRGRRALRAAPGCPTARPLRTEGTRPTSICPAVVVNRTSRSCVTRRELEAPGSGEDHQGAERDGEVDDTGRSRPASRSRGRGCPTRLTRAGSTRRGERGAPSSGAVPRRPAPQRRSVPATPPRWRSK